MQRGCLDVYPCFVSISHAFLQTWDGAWMEQRKTNIYIYIYIYGRMHKLRYLDFYMWATVRCHFVAVNLNDRREKKNDTPWGSTWGALAWPLSLPIYVRFSYVNVPEALNLNDRWKKLNDTPKDTSIELQKLLRRVQGSILVLWTSKLHERG